MSARMPVKRGITGLVVPALSLAVADRKPERLMMVDQQGQRRYASI
jgi:hypothetical protein